jgi:hypothetical protein
MKAKSLEETIRGLLNEQKMDIKSHIEEEEELTEVPVNVAIGKNRRRAKKTSFSSTSLGGKGQMSRSSAQRQGNQNKNRYEEFSYFAEQATKKVMKKLSEKNSEKALGKTATGKPGDIIDTEPEKPELTGPTR